MPIPVPALRTAVKFTGMFDFKDFYRNMIEVLTDKGYIDKGKLKKMERYYQEKHSSNPHEGRTVWVWWRSAKKEEGSPYFQRHMDLNYHLRFVRDVEVMEQGKKIRVQKGEIEVEINAYLLLDVEGKWEKHWFLKHVHPLFYKRIWAKRKYAEVTSLRGDAYFLQKYMKDVLELKQFTPQEYTFWKPGGYRVTY